MSKTRVENFRLLVALLLAAAACSRPTPPTPPPPTVVVAPVEQRDVPIEREWVGQTLGSADVAVRARVAGNVLGIHFEEGRPVAKGDLLFTIEPTEQQEKVAAAESDVAVARTRLAKADADLARIAPLAVTSGSRNFSGLRSSAWRRRSESRSFMYRKTCQCF